MSYLHEPEPNTPGENAIAIMLVLFGGFLCTRQVTVIGGLMFVIGACYLISDVRQ